MNKMLLTFLALGVASPLVASPATAAIVATDTALPVYQSGTSYSPSRGVDCSRYNPYWEEGEGNGCKLTLTTVTSGSNCLSETIASPTTGTVPVPSGATLCTVVISGEVHYYSRGGEECFLEAPQSLVVSFSSGRYNVFNGTFPASAIFKPTSTTRTGGMKTFRVTLTGGGVVTSGVAVAGSISASLNLTFGTALHPGCPDWDAPSSLNSKGGLSMAGPAQAPGGKIMMFA